LFALVAAIFFRKPSVEPGRTESAAIDREFGFDLGAPDPASSGAGSDCQVGPEETPEVIVVNHRKSDWQLYSNK
jgi:hypothetical protein